MFRPSGSGQVVLTYQGPSHLTIGADSAFAITVEVDGVVVPNPRLLLSVSDTLIFVVTSDQTALRGVTNGSGRLTARFHNSLLGDSLPTLVEQLNVRP